MISNSAILLARNTIILLLLIFSNAQAFFNVIFDYTLEQFPVNHFHYLMQLAILLLLLKISTIHFFKGMTGKYTFLQREECVVELIT